MFSFSFGMRVYMCMWMYIAYTYLCCIWCICIFACIWCIYIYIYVGVHVYVIVGCVYVFVCEYMFMGLCMCYGIIVERGGGRRGRVSEILTVSVSCHFYR